MIMESDRHTAKEGASAGRILVMVSLSRFSHSGDRTKAAATIQQIVTDFRSLYPGARISYRLLSEQELEDAATVLTRSGLGPDLILTSSSHLGRLEQLRMIQAPPRLPAERLRSFSPESLAALRQGSELKALPAYLNLRLMCFDRRQVQTPPATLEELQALDDQGASIGLGSDLAVLSWITGALGADIRRSPHPPYPKPVLERWSQWLGWAQQSPNVTITSFQDLLFTGLKEGRYDLISCPALWLPSLRRSLGRNLGIAPLPTGPAGPGRPTADLVVWAFGRNSSHEQRHLAMNFALFATNAEQERRVVLRHRSLMPVKTDVRLPLKADPELSTLQQVARHSVLLPLDRDEVLQKVEHEVTHLLEQVMAGELPARREAPHLLNLLAPTHEPTP
jgi:maltose-binding protein MalE